MKESNTTRISSEKGATLVSGTVKPLYQKEQEKDQWGSGGLLA
jgi:hypothetical protein